MVTDWLTYFLILPCGIESSDQLVIGIEESDDARHAVGLGGDKSDGDQRQHRERRGDKLALETRDIEHNSGRDDQHHGGAQIAQSHRRGQHGQRQASAAMVRAPG